jgi:hypothetical protein
MMMCVSRGCAPLAMGIMLLASLCGCTSRSGPGTPMTADIQAMLAPVSHGVLQEVVEDFGRYATPPAAGASGEYVPVPIERISTVVPWPRGLAMVDGQLIVLARGRHRSGGGVARELDDKAGYLFAVDPAIAEPVVIGELAGDAVRGNGRVLTPTANPPFFAYDYSVPAEDNILMDRPYCGMDYDPASRNLIICAFSGAELDGGRRFRKHATDALLRFDLRDRQWRVIEQHDHTIVPREALGRVIDNRYYPHHDPARHAPPHGWTNGPTSCAVVGRYLYATAKDNHLLVQYDLDGIRRDPSAPPPASRPVLGPRVRVKVDGAVRDMELLGTCAVAAHGNWLYVGYRTSSVVIRLPITDEGDLVADAHAELIAIFEPWDIESGRSGDMFDMKLNSRGDLFVSMAREGRVWRITPDPSRPFYANDRSDRPTTAPPFLDFSKLLGKRASCGNIVFDDQDRIYICTRTNDVGGGKLYGTIYRAATR